MSERLEFITIKQAMERYQLCRVTINKVAADADAIYKVGGNVRIDADKLDQYIRNNRR